MRDIFVRRRVRLPRSILVALPLALLILALGAGSAMGRTGRLANPAYSPSPATAGATVSFDVTFVDSGGAAPKAVLLVIDGISTVMSHSGSDYLNGVRFTATARPTVGTHHIWFRAIDSGDHSQELWVADLVVGPRPTSWGEADASLPSDPVLPSGLDGQERGSSGGSDRQPTPTIFTGFGGGTAWAAFALFGKKRRDDGEPDEGRLAAASGAAHETKAAQGLDPVDESTMPRWRRPSLQQVRRTDPLRAQQEEVPRMSFASAGVRPLENYERRTIGYRLVRLLDSPDELRATEIGIVDHGDEVQLLERHGAYWLVLCPDGRQGWLHRMTLADPPGAGSVDESEPMPQYMDEYDSSEAPPEQAEYVADPDADGLLEAYMSARRDVLKTMADETAALGDSTVPALEFQGATFAAVPDQFAIALEQFVEPESRPDSVDSVDAAPEDDFAPALEAVLAFEVEAPVSLPLVVESPVAPELERPAEEPPSSEPPAAAPARAGERYSARKNAGTRKAAASSRPGTKPRRPSR
jgi:hypothetical protein